MDSYEEEMEKYCKDPRVACKYARKCYQKNSDHHKKYKHPPKRRPSNDTDSRGHVKKQKLENKEGSNEKRTNSLLNYFKHSPHVDKQQTDDKNEPPTQNKNTEAISSSSEESTESNIEQENGVDHSPTSSKLDKKAFIKEKFLVEMPEDFYAFWELCKILSPTEPLKAFAEVDLVLVGPFDVLAEKFVGAENKSPEEYLIHWRYYYDPPEFQTVLKADDKHGYHIGYFRDSPKELPVFLASNCAEVDGVIKLMGDNIFAAVYLYLDEYKKIGDPFKRMKVPKLQSAVKAEAEKLKLSLSAKSPSITARDKKVVTRTFNRAGLIVPFNKKTQLGYRELAMSNKELHTLLHKLKSCAPEQRTKLLSDLQPVLTYASIALDECDFGTGVELGWNILFYGIDNLNATALRFLRDSYTLLGREAFVKIAEAHLSNRKKGSNLSVL